MQKLLTFIRHPKIPVKNDILSFFTDAYSLNIQFYRPNKKQKRPKFSGKNDNASPVLLCRIEKIFYCAMGRLKEIFHRKKKPTS